MTGAEAGRREPWFETREGGRFFVNLLLATPALVVLYPVAVKRVLEFLGVVEGSVPIFDTIPWVVGYVVPWVGWLSVIPLWFAWNTLAMELPEPARWTVRFFVALHAGVMAYTVLLWVV